MSNVTGRHQYVIVGGGLAGCTLAFLLKKAGQDVLLVERQRFSTKDKLCAGLVTPRSIDLLHEMFGSDVENVFRVRFDEMRCIADTHVVDLKGIRTNAVHRADLDRYVFEKYIEAGGKYLESFKLHSVDIENHIILGRDYNGDDLAISYEILIGADGAHSQTRKLVCGQYQDAILTLEARVDQGDCRYIMAYRPSFYGYYWYVPAGDRSKIGCGAFEGEHDLKQELQEFAEICDVKLGKIRGAFIPTGSDVTLRRGDVYFVGDAASLICPPSGEGIFYALFSAKQLSKALLNNASYEGMMQKHVMTIRRQLATRGLFFSERFMHIGLDLAGATPYGKESAIKFALRNFCSFEC